MSILFAIPDHPWVDAADGAAVRIAMTVAGPGKQEGILNLVTAEKETDGDFFTVDFSTTRGLINSDLTAGANVAGALELKANADICYRGVQIIGAGFIVTPEEAVSLGLGKIDGLEKHIRGYRNGRDLTASPREVMVIDLYGLQADDVRFRFPSVFQWILERVKPERDQNNRKSYRDKWWIFGEPRGEMRPALAALPRYIATVETSKHRFFQFLNASILPDNKLICMGLADAYHFGILSSRIHVAWALSTGSHLGVGNDPVYVKTRCFETFPFPIATDAQKARIRDLAEQLDAHRKKRQAEHADLTMTGMYNVLEKLRAGEALSAAEKKIHENGLVSVLKQLHDDLDAAVFDAYGWPTTLTDAEILSRLVALNAARAAEEATGLIRWLRPEYQCKGGAPVQREFGERDSVEPAEVGEERVQGSGFRTKSGSLSGSLSESGSKSAAKLSWPKSLPDQVRLLRDLLSASPAPVTAATLAKSLSKARVDKVEELLQTLVMMGQARDLGDGRYGV